MRIGLEAIIVIIHHGKYMPALFVYSLRVCTRGKFQGSKVPRLQHGYYWLLLARFLVRGEDKKEWKIMIGETCSLARKGAQRGQLLERSVLVGRSQMLCTWTERKMPEGFSEIHEVTAIKDSEM